MTRINRIRNKRQYSLYIVLLGFCILQLLGCSGQTGDRDADFTELKAFIDGIKVINTHEHQSDFLLREERDINFFTILYRSYINADFITTGAPRLRLETIDEGDHSKLWNMMGPYLDFNRTTSYYQHLVAGFRLLYGFDDIHFTEENTRSLTAAITLNYKDFNTWYDTAFKKAGFDLMLLDPHWDNFKMEKFYPEFALVMRLDTYITSISERSRLEGLDPPGRNNAFYQAKKEGHSISSLEDFLAFVDKYFQIYLKNNAVCAKSANAYNRSIEYEEVSFEEANALFERDSEELSASEKKKLQDFMFHWCVQKCAEYDLPLQIHTGYFAGNAKDLENGRPFKLTNLFLKYPDTKFVLFHGGYPWYPGIGALVKQYPHVYADFVWLAQISREAAVDAFHQWLDLAPYNKFFWGGDCTVIEASTGALEDFRGLMAQVLSERIESKRLTMEAAKDIAVKILRENALELYKLEEKMGRSFQ